ncbi:MAG: hypothetical protein WBB74_02640 [Gaiellaceae bacterium]
MSSFFSSNGPTWYVFREPQTDAIYLRRQGNSAYAMAVGCVNQLTIRVRGRHVAFSAGNAPFTRHDYRSTAAAWRALENTFAINRPSVTTALRGGEAASKPGWANAFDRDCLHRPN